MTEVKLNFGLSLDFSVQLKVSLSERLSERLSQKLKSPNATPLYRCNLAILKPIEGAGRGRALSGAAPLATP